MVNDKSLGSKLDTNQNPNRDGVSVTSSCNRFENEFIVAGGKGEPAEVMSEYGFKIGKVESRKSVFNMLGASPKEVKRKSAHERLGPVPIIKKHTKSPLGVEPSKEIKSSVPSRMRREADVNVLCGEVLKVRPKIIAHTSLQEENKESMESSYATNQNGKDVEAPKSWRVITWP
nr:hydrolase, putative [Ipomoea batatas]